MAELDDLEEMWHKMAEEIMKNADNGERYAASEAQMKKIQLEMKIKRLVDSGFPEREVRKANLELFFEEKFHKLKADLKKGKPASFVLRGSYGTGKTFLSICIAKQMMIDRDYDVIKICDSDIKKIAVDRKGFRPEREDVYCVSMLIIDDIGSLTYDNDMKEVLNEIVGWRAERGKSTILTTNGTISQYLQDKVVDRIKRDFTVMMFEGDSRR